MQDPDVVSLPQFEEIAKKSVKGLFALVTRLSVSSRATDYAHFASNDLVFPQRHSTVCPFAVSARPDHAIDPDFQLFLLKCGRSTNKESLL